MLFLVKEGLYKRSSGYETDERSSLGNEVKNTPVWCFLRVSCPKRGARGGLYRRNLGNTRLPRQTGVFVRYRPVVAAVPCAGLGAGVPGGTAPGGPARYGRDPSGRRVLHSVRLDPFFVCGQIERTVHGMPQSYGLFPKIRNPYK